ncbi:MAG: hypothetical protein A2206_02915 [Candidatus Magasanikbacteria bacterium RIFOXYA1_FULL_40_8]|uniref:Uncharacterized protein n=1 Tax=Candidatus Magasanikbacteria bacterium RIFOXYA1_FULL_40_8 TaxID=1798694 RepID=A0A1F6NTQ9_9BACT|nr:hypothetical protein [Candidatus Pacearchaeota archaeon]OGH87248.1 MAG: hypothetical protein A2206_02915 [Candidatus Magasanikbacteria bacterium RIFOXYA1_FULL_40_8]
MVIEEIVTSLKNAVAHGDSLETAIQLAINSGYNPKDVKEASQFVSGSAVSFLQPRHDEQFAMPAQKRFFTGNPVGIPKPNIQRPGIRPFSAQALQQPQQMQSNQMQPVPSSQFSKNQQIPPNTNQQQQNQNKPTQQTQQQNNLAQQTQQTQQQNNILQLTQPYSQSQQLQTNQPSQPITNQITNIRQDSQAIKQNISDGSVYANENSSYNNPFTSSSQSSSQSLSRELDNIKPTKEGHMKEILLLLVLIILIGLLILSFVFKNQILDFFTTLSG